MLSKTKLYDVLIEAGIKSGDIAHVQSDLRRIGVIEGVDSRQGILNFYYNFKVYILYHFYLKLLTSHAGT